MARSFERTSANTRAGVWLYLALSLAACGEPHWDTLRWPSERPGLPDQPVAEHAEAGVGLRVTQIDYEPEAVVVTLELRNLTTDAALEIESRGILLAWEELELPLAETREGREAPPETIELGPSEELELRLRYRPGRSLTDPKARLVLRAVTRDDEPILDPPILPIPPLPVSE